ncbi:MAG TPA: hypothetical protein VL688_04225, partial [Verrucomicrobiae bacterium]|nr:hypothetical protein [Verrucomicrobiae bacterium]
MPVYAATPLDDLTAQQNIATKTADSAAPSKPESSANYKETTEDFLSRDLLLYPEKTAREGNTEYRDYGQRIDMEEALSDVTTDYAAANILAKAPEARDLRTAANLNVEHAILVVDGEAVILTTGRQGEVLLNPAAKDMLKKAAAEGRVAMIAHNHPLGQDPKPGLEDIQAAAQFGGDILFYSYGIDAKGNEFAYQYDGKSVLNEKEPFGFDYLVSQFQKYYSPDQSTKDTRNLLSEFIKAVDEYNERDFDKKYAEPLVSQGPTVFPGFPVLGFFNGGGAPFMSQWNNQPQSTSNFRFDFDVSNGGFQGAVLNFGASEYGPQNLSGFTEFTWRMSTNPRCDGFCCSASCFTTIKIEFKDTNNNSASKVIAVTSTPQDYTILKSELAGINFNAIKEIIFIGETQPTHPGTGYFDITTGGMSFTPNLAPDPTKTTNDVTPVPAKADATKPILNTFASSDGSSANVVLTSSKDLTLQYNGTGAGSFGGAYFSYDLPSTGTVETVNLNTLFPNGIILEMDNSGGSLTSVNLEITDVNGNRDFVNFVSIDGTARRWVARPNQFEKIDPTKAVIFSLVVKGQANNQAIKVKWGNFAFTPSIPPDPNSQPQDITKLPLNSQGKHPALTTFASGGSTATLQQFSQTLSRITYNGINGDAFGGAFINYDDSSTGAIETINLNTTFPNGIIFQLDSPGTGINEIELEVSDSLGNVDSVKLTNILGFGQRWKILASQFDDVDRTKISVISLVIHGQKSNAQLTLDWGDFAFTPPIPPDPNSQPQDITKLPLNSQGKRPVLNTFASSDGSTSTLETFSETLSRVTYNGTGSNSFGGLYINYDNPGTGTVEGVNFNTLFPNGLVLQLDSPGTGISDVILEVTDATGKVDSVQLTNILGFGQRWKILPTQFDEVDRTKISIISLVILGQKTNAKLTLDWGNFAFTPNVPPDPNSQPQDITKLPLTSTGARPTLSAFASGDGSTANLQMFSETLARLTYNGVNGNSFGGMFVNYDNPSTLSIESINLNTLYPNGLIFQLDSAGANITDVVMEVTDSQGNVDSVKLTNILGFGQRWKVLPSQFDEVNAADIVTMSLVVLGQESNSQLTLQWGDFDVTKEIGPDPTKTEADITKLPLLSTGERPSINAFSSTGSTATITNLGQTFATVNYNGANATAFGGAFIAYDNPNTTNTVEAINFNTAFPGGLVLQVDSPNVTSVLLELTDAAGKKDTARLVQVDTFGKRWLIQGNA